MKKIFYLLFFYFLINSSLSNANENIVFIDMNLILEKSHQGKKILDKLSAINEENKNNLETKNLV